MTPAIVLSHTWGKGAVLANPYSVSHAVRLFAQPMLIVIATCMPESPTYSLYETLFSGSARIAEFSFPGLTWTKTRVYIAVNSKGFRAPMMAKNIIHTTVLFFSGCFFFSFRSIHPVV